MKVIKYNVISVAFSDEKSSIEPMLKLISRVNHAIGEGWQPYGNLIFTPETENEHSHLEQIIVMYEENK